MVLSDLLTEDLIILDLEGSTRDEVMEELVDCLERAGALRNRQEYVKALYESEEQGTNCHSAPQIGRCYRAPGRFRPQTGRCRLEQHGWRKSQVNFHDRRTRRTGGK